MSNSALWTQAGHTLTVIGQQNPNTEHIKRLHDGHLTDLVQAIMEGTLPDRDKVRDFYGLGPLIPEIFDLEIDFDLGLSGMIGACGCDRNNENITPEGFPITEKGKLVLEGKLFHFKEDIFTPDAENKIRIADKANPWEPGQLFPLLAFGRKYPNAQLKFPVIGLGSATVVECHPCMPYLGKDALERLLNLGRARDGWGAICRFLGVRKKKLPVPQS